MSEPRLELTTATRRGFLLAGLGFVMTACSKTQEAVTMLPAPAWDMHPTPGPRLAQPVPAAAAGPVRSRAEWATGAPVPALMDPMAPIRHVTIHHDGMQPFHGSDDRAAEGRLDAIRRAHRSKDWGDIGYHFAVDRAGNVWEARPLRYQGAHVKNCNEGNIGIVVLGNFDRQRPTDTQVEALRGQTSMLMRVYGVPPRNLRTHQEWAATRCPGRHLQQYMVGARSNGWFG
ncbi:MAG: N-acetylmuramoyl-L-alanine amidase [Planctomycetes bacterium]|nr:N-acetylmuramoyl-L-alanine amidase [Planctomycetota bacterium]